MPHRVIQWSTGNVGKLALRAIIERPDLELVGLWVHGASKVGRDAGELCGLPPTGIKATNDVAALLALDADCVSYTATADLRPSEAVDDMCRMLEAGKNVVSTSVVSMIYPPAADASLVEKLQAACLRGGTSFFTSGIDPGFANDLVPITLLGACQRVDSVRVMEVLNYDTYDQAEVLFETMGFAKPLDHTPLILIPGVLTIAWGSVVRVIAAALGVEIEEIREKHERRPAERAFDIAAGHVPKGNTAALRFEIQGVVHGRPAIVVEHVTRLTDDIAPDWPKLPGGGGYRIIIDGNPSYSVDLHMRGEDGDHNTGGILATAMRVLNAIPAVCAAKPGVLSLLDLPVATARGAMYR